MTLLTIVGDIAARIGVPAPTQVVASTETTAQRLLALVNQSGRELMRRHNWTILVKEKTFTTTADDVQTGALPTDFDRFVDGTIFNRTRSQHLIGPLTPQEWQAQVSLSVGVLTDAFRIRGSDFLITPDPPAGQTIVFEYVSKYWVDTDGDGDGDAFSFLADSQNPLLDEEMLIEDTVWRYKQSVGTDYAEDHATAQRTILARINADGGKRTLNFGGYKMPSKPIGPVVPEGNWLQD